jgi:antibiotic biosynthesis monooxygenase (ABM) superfamily enzyme
MVTNQPITVVVTRRAKAGREKEFEAALHSFVAQSLNLPGQLGVNIMRPAPGTESREYSIVRRFKDREALEQFRFSPGYLTWNDTVVDLTEGSGTANELSGLETWFTLPGTSRVRSIPRWKMAIVTLLGVYPISGLLGVYLAPNLSGVPYWARTLIISAAIVGLLTWVVMPRLTRALKGWLYPAHSESIKKENV